MVRKIPDKNLYQCEECGLQYREEGIAKKCQDWCQKHKTCNLEIITHAVENNENK